MADVVDIDRALDERAMVVPSVCLDLHYSFANDNPAAGFGQLNGESAGPTGVRGRTEVGMRANASNGMSLDVSGSYDGIGLGSYSAFTGRATLRLPLN